MLVSYSVTPPCNRFRIALQPTMEGQVGHGTCWLQSPPKGTAEELVSQHVSSPRAAPQQSMG